MKYRMFNKPQHIVTVCIDRSDIDGKPWVSAFSSRPKAEAFRQKLKDKLIAYGVSDLFIITIDSGDLDDEQYLEWIDQDFGEE